MEEALFDPFTVEPDPEEQKVILLRALEMAQGFALYFVVCDPGSGRTALIQELVAYFPEKQIQAVPVTSETDNLFHLLQTRLPSPAPDAVFVYGLENWISGAVDPRSLPFIRNLNAARNSFYDLVQSPLVFFVARHVLQAIINGAPDFFSVRSGVYVFPLSPAERKARALQTKEIGQHEILGLSPAERNDRIAEGEHLLAELRSFDNEQRDLRGEAFLLNQLGVAYLSLDKLTEAKPFLTEAVKIKQDFLKLQSPELAISLANLAGVYKKEEQHTQAEKLFTEALAICRRETDHDIQLTANCLNSLAEIYEEQGQYQKSETFLLDALKIRCKFKDENPIQLARTLDNLATTYQMQGRHTEAEDIFLESERLLKENLPANHPYLAASLNNRAILYGTQGRLSEAEPLYLEALKILRDNMDEEHSDVKKSKK